MILRSSRIYQTLFRAALLYFVGSKIVTMSELFKIVQTITRLNPDTSVGGLKIAIVGSGYAGLACGFYSSKVAKTVTIFGLEDSPGEQQGTSASTISAGLLHPLTPRGRLIYRGEEAFGETLSLLTMAQQHSRLKIFRSYPFENSFHEVSPEDGVIGECDKSRVGVPLPPSAPPKSPRIIFDAMLRPLFRDTDFSNWQKAASSNSKWVAMLSDEQRDMLPHCEVPEPDESDANICGDTSTSEMFPPADSADDGLPATPRHLLGVAVIRNAIVVDSTAYLKGLWNAMCTAETKVEPPSGRASEAAIVTYEKRNLSHSDLVQLSKEFDVVIVAAGAGIQALWGHDQELPFSYVRGQNIEMRRADEGEGEGVVSLESVLLAGEYIVPKTRTHHEGEGEKGKGEDTFDREKQIFSSGEVRSNDRLQVQGQGQGQSYQAAPSDSYGAYRTLIVGGTHEHALTMEELGLPPDMARASSLLMPKIRDMYPALTSEGWEPFKCIAGIRVVPARTNLGRLPAAGRHPKLNNVWLMGGLGSRGLLYHALLAQLVVQAATDPTEEREEERQSGSSMKQE